MIRLCISAILAIALSFLGVSTHSAFAQTHGHDHTTPSTAIFKKSDPEVAAFAQAMAAGMEKMMVNMYQPGMTENPDVDFLAMMISHHEGAVEMSRLLLIHGVDPLVRQLAEEIITSQQLEIGAMKARLSTLKQGANPDPEGFPALTGVRGN